jgi:hypothetical protein
MGTPVTVDVLANDQLGDTPTTITAVAPALAGGTVTTDGLTVTYTPAAGFTGVDAFTYTITDADGETSTATVAVTVTNAVPLAVDDVATTHMGTPVTVDVLANDQLGDTPTTITAVTDGANGTVVDNGDGTVTYTPSAGFIGADTFTYTITDADGETSTANVAVTVTNAVPLAVPDFATTDVDTPVTINVLGNDDLGDEPTAITAFDATSVLGGTVVDNGDGTLTYTPAAGFTGTDAFTYTITDADGETSTTFVIV